MAVCRTCQSPIVWATTNAGRSVPLDAEPTADGRIVVYDGPSRPGRVATVLDDEAVDAARTVGHPLFTSHFVTCPDADQWRKNRKAGLMGSALYVTRFRRPVHRLPWRHRAAKWLPAVCWACLALTGYWLAIVVVVLLLGNQP